MGKKILQLFLDTMLRAIVVILAIAIIIVAALLVKKNKENQELEVSKEETIATEITTEEPDENDLTFTSSSDSGTSEDGTTDEASVSSLGATILVINSTGTSGVAGAWRTYLTEEGFSDIEVGTYTAGYNTTTTVYTSGDYDGADLGAYFTDTQYGTVDSLSASDFDVDIEGYEIIIVVGKNDVKS